MVSDMSSDDYVHIFRTTFGLPPSKNERPICGAALTDAYDFPRRLRPNCERCMNLATLGVASIVRDTLGDDDA